MQTPTATQQQPGGVIDPRIRTLNGPDEFKQMIEERVSSGVAGTAGGDMSPAQLSTNTISPGQMSRISHSSAPVAAGSPLSMMRLQQLQQQQQQQQIKSFAESDSSSDDEEIRLFLRPSHNLKGDNMIAREEHQRSVSRSPPSRRNAAAAAAQNADDTVVSFDGGNTTNASAVAATTTASSPALDKLSKFEQAKRERLRKKQLEEERAQAAAERAASLSQGMREIAVLLADARFRSKATAEAMLPRDREADTSVSFLTQHDPEQRGAAAEAVAERQQEQQQQQPLENLLARALLIKAKPEDISLAAIKLHSALQRKKQRTAELHSQIDIIKGQLQHRAQMVENLRGTLWREVMHLRMQLSAKITAASQQQQMMQQFQQHQQHVSGAASGNTLVSNSSFSFASAPESPTTSASPSPFYGVKLLPQASVGLSDDTFHMLELALRKYDNPSDAMPSLLDKAETLAGIVSKLLDEAAHKTNENKELRRRITELNRDLATANSKVQQLYKLTGNDLGASMLGRAGANGTMSSLRGQWILPMHLSEETEASMMQRMLSDALQQNEEFRNEIEQLKAALTATSHLQEQMAVAAAAANESADASAAAGGENQQPAVDQAQEQLLENQREASLASSFSISTHDEDEEEHRKKLAELMAQQQDEEEENEGRQPVVIHVEQPAAAAAAAGSEQRPTSASSLGGGVGVGSRAATPFSAASETGTNTDPQSQSQNHGNNNLQGQQQQQADSESATPFSSSLGGGSRIADVAMKQRYQAALKERLAVQNELKATQEKLAALSAEHDEATAKFAEERTALETQISDLHAAAKKAARAPQQANDAAMRAQAELKRKLDDALSREAETAQKLFEAQQNNRERALGGGGVGGDEVKELLEALYETALGLKRSWFSRELESAAAMHSYFMTAVLGRKTGGGGRSVSLGVQVDLGGDGSVTTTANRNAPAGKRGGAAAAVPPLGRGKTPAAGKAVPGKKPGSKRGSGGSNSKNNKDNDNDGDHAQQQPQQQQHEDSPFGSTFSGLNLNSRTATGPVSFQPLAFLAETTEGDCQTDAVQVMSLVEYSILKAQATPPPPPETAECEVQTTEAWPKQTTVVVQQAAARPVPLQNDVLYGGGAGSERRPLGTSEQQKELERLAALLMDQNSAAQITRQQQQQQQSHSQTTTMGEAQHTATPQEAAAVFLTQQQQQQQSANLIEIVGDGGEQPEQQQQQHQARTPQTQHLLGGTQQHPPPILLSSANTTVLPAHAASNDNSSNDQRQSPQPQQQQQGASAVESEIAAIAAARVYRGGGQNRRRNPANAAANAAAVVISSATLAPWLDATRQAVSDGNLDGTNQQQLTAQQQQQALYRGQLVGSEAMRVQQMLLHRQQQGLQSGSTPTDMSTARLEHQRRLSVISHAGGGAGGGVSNNSLAAFNTSMSGFPSIGGASTVSGAAAANRRRRGESLYTHDYFDESLAQIPIDEADQSDVVVLCYHRPAQTDPVDIADDPRVIKRLKEQLKPPSWTEETSFESFLRKQKELKEKERALRLEQRQLEMQQSMAAQLPSSVAGTNSSNNNNIASRAENQQHLHLDLSQLVDKVELAHKELAAAVTTQSAAYRGAVLERWGFDTRKPALWMEQRFKAISSKLVRMAEASLDLAVALGEKQQTATSSHQQRHFDGNTAVLGMEGIPADVQERLMQLHSPHDNQSNNNNSTKATPLDAAAENASSIIAGASLGAERERDKIQRMQSVMHWTSTGAQEHETTPPSSFSELQQQSIARQQQQQHDRNTPHHVVDATSQATFALTPPPRLRRNQALIQEIVEQHKHDCNDTPEMQEAAKQRRQSPPRQQQQPEIPPELEAHAVHLIDRHDPFSGSRRRSPDRTAAAVMVPPLSTSSAANNNNNNSTANHGRGGQSSTEAPSVSLSAVLNLEAMLAGERAFLNSIPQGFSVIDREQHQRNKQQLLAAPVSVGLPDAVSGGTMPPDAKDVAKKTNYGATSTVSNSNTHRMQLLKKLKTQQQQR